MGHSIPIFGVSLICGVVGCVMGCSDFEKKLEYSGLKKNPYQISP
jgi:hypothetical protein